MFPCIFWERLSFIFCPMKNNHVFGKKIPTFQIMQERSSASRALFGKTIFSEGLKKIYFHVFFKKDHLSFFVQGVRSYFRKKKISSFPIIQATSCSSAIMFGKTIFSGRPEKEILVFCAVWLLFKLKKKKKSLLCTRK